MSKRHDIWETQKVSYRWYQQVGWKHSILQRKIDGCVNKVVGISDIHIDLLTKVIDGSCDQLVDQLVANLAKNEILIFKDIGSHNYKIKVLKLPNILGPDWWIGLRPKDLERVDNLRSTKHVETKIQDDLGSTEHVETEIQDDLGSTEHVETEIQDDLGSTKHVEVGDLGSTKHVEVDNLRSTKHVETGINQIVKYGMVILGVLVVGYGIYLLVNRLMKSHDSQDTEDANDADSYSYLPDGTTMTAGEIEELFTT